MSDKRMSVVWICGAGFSRPLGGPLLTDLFSLRLFNDLKASFGESHKELKREIQLVHNVYYGMDDQTKPPKNALAWTNAEEFLELLDFACCQKVPQDQRDHAVRLISQAAQKNKPDDGFVKTTAQRARRYFVLACSAFLDRAFTEGERWAPFERRRLNAWCDYSPAMQGHCADTPPRTA